MTVPDESTVTSTPSAERAALSQALITAGRSLGNASSMLSHACAERLGLHATDWECISLLTEAAPEALTAGQLAGLTGLTTGAMTGVIDRLEAAGFVHRERDPADRRRVIVRLDDQKMVETMPMFAGMLADMVRLHADHSDADLATFAELLTRASEVLRRHAIAIRAGTRGSRPSPAGR